MSLAGCGERLWQCCSKPRAQPAGGLQAIAPRQGIWDVRKLAENMQNILDLARDPSREHDHACAG